MVNNLQLSVCVEEKPRRIHGREGFLITEALLANNETKRTRRHVPRIDPFSITPVAAHS